MKFTKLRRAKRPLLFGLAGVVVLPFLAACQNVQTFSSQCAYIIHNGYFDARHVEQILLPGERGNHNNATVRYVYCNARNFRIQPGGDVPGVDHISAKTAPSSNGDGTPVDVELEAYFSVNQNHSALLSFLPFCEKYSCFSDKDTAGNQALDNSSSEGWNNMLKENFPNAINRSTQQAMLKFAPNIWNDTSQWPKVADAISANFASQMQIQDSSPDGLPFFCDQGATPTTCKLVRFAIESITPSDPNIRDIYNQQVEQQQQQLLARQQAKTNADLLAAAKKKYGPYASYFLGLQDTINKCNDNASCTVILGSGGGSPSISVGSGR